MIYRLSGSPTEILYMLKADVHREAICPDKKRRNNVSGFSFIEIMIVLVILAILSAISIPYIYNSKRLYKSDDQAIKIMDLMREAQQLALTKRRTMRLEIDRTDNVIMIIDEGTVAPAVADRAIKVIPLEERNEVEYDQIPTGVAKPNPPNYNDAGFGNDTLGHDRDGTNVTGHQVWAARYQSDGSVVNAAGNPTSVNLYIYPPSTSGSTTPRSKTEVRAITLFGSSGAIRYWKHDGTTFVPY